MVTELVSYRSLCTEGAAVRRLLERSIVLMDQSLKPI